MSVSAPGSPTHSESVNEGLVASPTGKRTRTVAMIKYHALGHRFDIETRITEAGFEIVKERQMDFDIETDPETMFELFGEDYKSFAEGPVWVYVLERADAVEAFQDLMGHPDPSVAKQQSPNSLRALYGISEKQNAVMGSPDEHTAEVQILSIFVSSPPFPTSELPETSDNSLPPSDSSLNFEYQKVSPSSKPHRGRGTSERSSERSSTVNGRSSTNGKSPFRARPIPVTTIKPDIVPRLSRAAALRIGVPVEDTKPKRYPATPESLARTFAGVPGHKRSETIHVASTEPPAIPPRMTRAMSLRLGLDVSPKPKARPSTSGGESNTFEGVPGHKRRESIPVASTRPPVMPPRTNRSATLRIQKEAAPPSSFNIRNPEAFPRSASRTSLNGSTARPPSSASSARPLARSNSALALKPSNGVNVTAPTTPEPPASKPKARPSVVTAPPTITPRTNKSAQLRAAKMASNPPAVQGRANGTNGSAAVKTPARKVVAPRVAKVADV